jgi:L-malate glycosyltransferase
VIARLRTQLPEVRALLAGHGGMDEEVRAEVRRLGLESVVHLLGQRDDIPVILSASQLLLLVSENEGTPNVVLEAQHCGCVPVATDVGGVRETLARDVSGLLCSKDDLAGLTQAVASLLQAPDRRAAMARAGQAFVAQHFEPAAVHAQTMALYAAMLGSTPQLTSHAA